MKKTRSKELPE